jgi:uncharacterized membrane protein
MACAIVAVAMMFPEWTVAKFLGQESTENGFDRSLVPAGPILLVILLVAVVATAGYTLLAKKPQWLLFAAVPAFAALMVVIVTMTTLSKIGGDLLGALPGGSSELGVGAWLCLVFTIAAVCLSLYPLVGMMRRPAPPPPPSPEFPHAEGD